MNLPARWLLFFVVVLLTGAASASMDPAYMDRTVSPCKNFYQYACGAYDSHPIPDDYAAFGVNEELDQRTERILRAILETSAEAPGARGTVTQRVGDFFASGMDEAAIERAGLSPLKNLLAAIDAVEDRRALGGVIGLMQASGCDAGFGLMIGTDDRDSTVVIPRLDQSGGLGLPERGYYFREGEEAEKVRVAYRAMCTRLLALAGVSEEAARGQADRVFALETHLARGSLTLAQLRDPIANYHKLTREEVSALAPTLGWDGYFRAISLPAFQRNLLVGQPGYFKGLETALQEVPLDDWRAYLRVHLLESAAPYLGHAFEEAHFAFHGKTLSGTPAMKPRWKRVLRTVDGLVGEDLGQLFVRKAFSPAAKAKVQKMVRFHLDAMRVRIRASQWMSPATQQVAMRKLDTMRVKIGYPDRWRDYTALQVTRGPYVANVLAANVFEFRRQIAKLGKPVDRGEWFMTPPTNNAYYEPTLNEMCFPAGILQPPFFDEKADDADNYGGLASTIGHELTHAFDDYGRQYDENGNLRDWWAAQDVKRFEERADLVVAQYDAYEPLPGLKINGRQTLGENIADIGGLRVAFDAYHMAIKGRTYPTTNGLTADQRFFVAFAQSWRTNMRPERLRTMVQSNEHSPPRFRVIGPVSDLEAFYTVFGDKGADMPPPTRNPIW